MRKIGKALVASALAVGSVYADVGQTNKTFLATRPVSVNLGMERTTWHSQINRRITDADDKFGGSLQVVGFYQESTNDDRRGKYFGFNNKRSLVVGQAQNGSTDIDREHLIHRPSALPLFINGAEGALTGTVNLSFSQKAAGVRIDYYQDLDNVVRGMYFKVNLPIVWEQTKASLGVSSGATSQLALFEAAPTTSRSIQDYFSGNITQTWVNVKQDALLYGKITGNSHDHTSLADIDLMIGWNWEDRDHTWHAGANLGVTFPTGETPDSIFLFESNGGGNRGHWGLGFGLDAHVRAWEREEQYLMLDFALNHRYLFKDTERRILGVKNKNWAQYQLMGQTGVAKVFPGANVLRQKVDVTPGNQIDMYTGLSYMFKNFYLDLGYNLYAREQEEVKRRSDQWTDSTYAFAGADYDTTAVFAAANIPNQQTNISLRGAGATGTFIPGTDLDVAVAETKAQTTHKLVGGLGYAFNQWDTPLMLGVGGAYEFAPSQKSVETWQLWGKLGVSF
jgi:hypothetical protein